ncbi:GNS1/SUR4 family-domain-containing protein [Lipomyces oligophaga]|uniref:GNS1/SUR4 family-domain-containing protein n=1 Tax=Lipomyces oligophaga TaxID=45792 RepID=UPI0034CEB329
MSASKLIRSSNSSVYLASPPGIMFKLPMGIDLPPGPPEGSLFAEYFNWTMDIRVPITIATVYATCVHILNRSRGPGAQPARFARTALFRWLVIVHNTLLCLYSGWTFIGMTSSMVRTVLDTSRLPSSERGSWPFWSGLCSAEGIWSRGLSYYGFLFYLSKFYEVLDTAIILAKGKRSSLLQTYHHAGAMLSMWAGVRFAAPPIWVFVVFNSLIHTLMYFYYVLSGLKIPVPRALKRALTTAQICQFVFGGSLAFLHMFVYYIDPAKNSYNTCLVDPGQMFALLFNVAYLTPLTYLFVSFWIESYVRAHKRQLRPEKSAKSAKPASSAKETKASSQ